MNYEIAKSIFFSRHAVLFYGLVGLVLLVNLSLKLNPLLLVALICIPFVTKIILKYPFVSTVGLYVFLIPFDSVLALGSETQGTTLTRVIGFAVIALLFAEGTLSNKLNQPDSAVIGWILFIFLGVCSVAWAIYPSLAVKRVGTAVGLLLLYLVLSSYKATTKEFDIVCKTTVFSGVAATIYVIVMFAIMGNDFTEMGRLSVSYEDRGTDENQFAFSLIIPFAMALKYIFEEKRMGYKIVYMLMAILIAFAVIVSGSRGGLFALLVMLLIFFFGARQSKKHLLIMLGITCLLILVFNLLPEFFWLRLIGAIDSSGAGRIEIWNVGYAAWKHYFLTGAGLNNFPVAYGEFVTLNPFGGDYKGSHNIYLCIAVELGLLGLIFFASAAIKHFRLLLGNCDYTSLALKASFAGILTASFFLDVIWRKPFWLLWIMIILFHNQNKQSAMNNFYRKDT